MKFLKLRSIGSLLLLLVSLSAARAQSAGPENGSLILTGGDLIKDALDRFVSLAGGPDANFVYIPTAASSLRLPSGFIYDPPDSDTPAANTQAFETELARLFGVKRVTLLHTRNRKTADSRAFVSALQKANGVWLSSGNPGRLAQAYLDTRTLSEIEGVLKRGGVVGGNSAGSIIQGSYIVRGRPDKPVLMVKGRERGFGFLKKTAVNPHLTEQKRETELITVIDYHPELLGIGMDERTAIVVRGHKFQVIGEGRVAIYDNQKHGNNWYYWLKPGDSFDLKTRRKITP